MSVKKSTNTTFDGRSFIELYFSLPEAGRMDLTRSLVAEGVCRGTVYGWLHGRTASHEKILACIRVIKRKYRITTEPVSLFPSKDRRLALAAKYEPFFQETGSRKKNWDGKVNWPSLRAQQEGEE